MIKRTLYFGNPAYLSLRLNQLVIKLPEVEKADLPADFKQATIRTIPIEDIGIVILDHKQITITHGVIEQLIANNCALITCNSQRMPHALMLPLNGNTTQTESMLRQIEASLPLKKQLWQQTISAKINNQAGILHNMRGETVTNMQRWATDVRSGDPDNYEARAAAYYWRNIFPSLHHFTRDREGCAPNNLLNYGYAILRAIIARALVASGLLPTFGIHHHNKYNAYCLADDIMEPYRPYVDQLVITIFDRDGASEQITLKQKNELLSIPTIDVNIGGKRSPLMIAATTTTSSLQKCYAGEARKIIYPSII